MPTKKPQDVYLKMRAQTQASANVNRLTLVFAKAVSQGQKDKSDNLVVSPYNALTVLSMVAKGAGGTTREEMADVLYGSNGKRLDSDIKAFADLNTAILESNKDAVILKDANGVWVNKNQTKLRKAYATQIRRIFSGTIDNRKFDDEKLPGDINGWADKSTNGMIDKIVKEMPNDALVFLAGALAFEGLWTRKFDKELTKLKEFLKDGKDKIKIPTMHMDFQGKERVSYLDGDDCEAISLTFGENNPQERKQPTMRLLLMRPKDESQSAREWLEAQADKTEIPEWLSTYDYESAKGEIELGRVAVKQRHDLKQILQDMGIKQAFTDAADFSGMTSDGAKIGSVIQDTLFTFDEDGGKAASVTQVTMAKLTAVGPSRNPREIDLKFDRSYAFALQDVSTGTILFYGAINHPDKDEALMPKKSGLLDAEGKPIVPQMV